MTENEPWNNSGQIGNIRGRNIERSKFTFPSTQVKYKNL